MVKSIGQNTQNSLRITISRSIDDKGSIFWIHWVVHFYLEIVGNSCLWDHCISNFSCFISRSCGFDHILTANFGTFQRISTENVSSRSLSVSCLTIQNIAVFDQPRQSQISFLEIWGESHNLRVMSWFFEGFQIFSCTWVRFMHFNTDIELILLSLK